MLKKFTIFGNPVVHSKSPQMHNKAFDCINYNAIYTKHLLENGKNIKEIFLKENYQGANITVPHKEIAYKNADEIVGIANKIKAVNTYINKDGKIIAYNTDAAGFLKAIQDFGEINNVLLLGAGGTAKAIALALKEKNIKTTVLNRSEEKLKFFKDENINCFSWDTFEPEIYDLVVNSTSAGLKDDFLPYDKKKLKQILKNSSYAFDCVYGKITPFLALAKEQNCNIKDGEDMLLYQGVLAFELFTDTKADEKLIKVMREALREE